MAHIEVSAKIQGEAVTQAMAGRCLSVSAICRGRAASGLGAQPIPEDNDLKLEPQPPQGK